MRIKKEDLLARLGEIREQSVMTGAATGSLASFAMQTHDGEARYVKAMHAACDLTILIDKLLVDLQRPEPSEEEKEKP